MAYTYFQKGQNFSPHEKLILVELVAKHGHDIVQRKSNDNTSLAQKDRVWQEIYLEYNRQYGVNERSEKQLKLLWKNLKAKCKREFYQKVAERQELGGSRWEKTQRRTPPPGINIPLSTADVLRKLERLLQLEETLGEDRLFLEHIQNTVRNRHEVKVEVLNQPEDDVTQVASTNSNYDEGWQLEEADNTKEEERIHEEPPLPASTTASPTGDVMNLELQKTSQISTTAVHENHKSVDESEKEDYCPHVSEACSVSQFKGETAPERQNRPSVDSARPVKEVDHQRQMLKLAKQEHDMKMMTMRMKRKQTMQINRREHLARMENYKLEKDILKLKKRKLELEIKNGLYMDDDDDLAA